MASRPSETLERLIESRGIAREPNWLTGNLMGYGVTVEAPLDVVTAEGVREVPEPLQQSDLLKPFYMDIARYGLSYAYQKYGGVPPTPGESLAGTGRSKHVIIVGAGMAGLVVARELKRVGHRVTILETQERIGGRVKTMDHKDGFQQGLYVDGESADIITVPFVYT